MKEKLFKIMFPGKAKMIAELEKSINDQNVCLIETERDLRDAQAVASHLNKHVLKMRERSTKQQQRIAQLTSEKKSLSLRIEELLKKNKRK